MEIEAEGSDRSSSSAKNWALCWLLLSIIRAIQAFLIRAFTVVESCELL
jgi:hypothetical protein